MEVPSQTLYIRNLNDKINKQQLRRCLYHLLAPFGYIYQIHLNSSFKMRGQAFVVFDSIDHASQALSALCDFSFLGKEMKISYAKTKSDVVAQKDGSYNTKMKQERQLKRMRERLEKLRAEQDL